VTRIAVTDSHALIWYSQQRWRNLGRRALSLFRDADAGSASLVVPTIALTEVLEGARAGTVTFPTSASDWLEALTASGSFLVADLTTEVVLRAHSLYTIPERGDRLIAATAAVLDYPLITRDPAIGKAAGVEVVWG
jgi:PIN domain nuclease of toxin-antitoxin system